MTYPNGRVLYFCYNSGDDNALNRLSYLADAGGGAVATQLAAYQYLGLGSIVQVNCQQGFTRYLKSKNANERQ